MTSIQQQQQSSSNLQKHQHRTQTSSSHGTTHTAMLGCAGTARLRKPKVDPRLAYYESCAFAAVENEYREDLIANLKEQELNTMPNASMIDVQPEIEWFMRPYLLDFLVDTHLTLKLSPSTLFLAVNIVDRYCSKRIVAKKHYQLVGCTSLWLASKLEDKKSHIPQISELISMCCGVYEEAMFLQMEGHILNTLEWSINHPSVETFLKLLLGSKCNPTLSATAHYFAEVSMYHRDFFAFRPSVIAASCVALASHIVTFASSTSTTTELNLAAAAALATSTAANIAISAAHITGLKTTGFETANIAGASVGNDGCYPSPSSDASMSSSPMHNNSTPSSSSSSSSNNNTISSDFQIQCQCISLLNTHMSTSTNSLQKKYMSMKFHQVPTIISNFISFRSKIASIALPPSPPPEYYNNNKHAINQNNSQNNCENPSISAATVAAANACMVTPPMTPP